MKVLLVHNFYRSDGPSGENAVYDAEKELLLSRGVNVIEYNRHSDCIGKGMIGTIKGGLSTPWSIRSAKEVRKLVNLERPDIVHVHNTFPLISPSIFWGIGKKAATVLTLHNYRLLCPAAIPMRDNQVCIDCIHKQNTWSSIKFGCYRGSRLATIPLAAGISLHRQIGTWHKAIDAFIALSNFQKDLMSKYGLPHEKVFVKPNFFPGDPKIVNYNEREPYIVFVGRLSPEKGLRTLINAWGKWGENAPLLKIIGDGPLMEELKINAQGLPVQFLGKLKPEHTHNEIAGAKLLVLPSEWFEGFPMVVREAFAFGTPIAASSIGPLPSIVEHKRAGVTFEPADSDSIVSSIKEVWGNDTELMSMSVKARDKFDQLYTEDVCYSSLINIYEKAILSNSRIPRKGNEL